MVFSLLVSRLLDYQTSLALLTMLSLWTLTDIQSSQFCYCHYFTVWGELNNASKVVWIILVHKTKAILPHYDATPCRCLIAQKLHKSRDIKNWFIVYFSLHGL